MEERVFTARGKSKSVFEFKSKTHSKRNKAKDSKRQAKDKAVILTIKTIDNERVL